jgi:hypothetical protein
LPKRKFHPPLYLSPGRYRATYVSACINVRTKKCAIWEPCDAFLAVIDQRKGRGIKRG